MDIMKKKNMTQKAIINPVIWFPERPPSGPLLRAGRVGGVE